MSSMNSTLKYDVEQIKEEDLKIVYEWQADSWNLELRDIEVYYHAYPNGWKAVYIDGQLAGCATGFQVSDCYGFVGMVFVGTQFRKRGIAKTLLSAVKEYLQVSDPKRRVALNSVYTLPPFYSQYGFKIQAWTIVCFVGTPDVSLLPDYVDDITIVCKDYNLLNNIQDILTYDLSIHPCDRSNYWQLMGKYSEVKCVLAKDKKDEETVGFGCIQPVPTGYRIAPLYANSVSIARCLMKKLCQSLNSNNSQIGKDDQENPLICIDSISCNDNVYFFEKELQMNIKPNGNIRMYTQEDEIAVPWGNVYGLANTDVHVV